jgi:peroxiredoxin/predicted 2-oxoglutarate/Fe(II)-dependent dioxygenase YbiX
VGKESVILASVVLCDRHFQQYFHRLFSIGVCYMSTLSVGDPAPWFTIASTSNPNYHFDTVGGYRVILFFFGSAKNQSCRVILDQFLARTDRLEAAQIPFFGVSVDPDDRDLATQIHNPTYFKFLWDFDQTVSRLYGVCQPQETGDRDSATPSIEYAPTVFVLNENLRIVGVWSLSDLENDVDRVLHQVMSLPEPELTGMGTRQAPVLFIPQVFSPQLCQHLIQLYETNGGRESGFMRQVDGKTVEVFDHEFKKRQDLLISDPVLLEHINTLILRRVKPEIEKAFQFSITRFERHLVACYRDSDRGFFNRHRDNTTKGTAHRRFAMSLNLNTGEYEGGCLRFPEYGSQLYRPDVGEAIIFSCSLLHEATPVTSGKRFTLLSFFYNDDDAQLRDRNRKYVVTGDRPSTPSTLSQTAESSSSKSKAKAKRGFQPQAKHQ